jgi:hypothetical protein
VEVESRYSALSFKRHAARGSRDQFLCGLQVEPAPDSTSAAKQLRKYAYPALQGLKPLKKTQTLCRAYPSFVRIKRHDPQNLRLFLQPVKPTEKNFAATGRMVRETHHKSLPSEDIRNFYARRDEIEDQQHCCGSRIIRISMRA